MVGTRETDDSGRVFYLPRLTFRFTYSFFVTISGTVVGWISETDIDSAGEPGFVSDKTGKPACLFHVTFPEDNHHQYASLLIQSQDLEEYELLEVLIPANDEEESMEPPKKKSR